MNQTTTEILASRVTPEGAALLLAMDRFTAKAEPNVSKAEITGVPGWTDSFFEERDQLKERCSFLEVENKLLLDAVKNPAQAKGWRYPKPGDKLRVVKVPPGSYDFVKVGTELEASAFCETTHYDSVATRASYAVTCGSPAETAATEKVYVVLPLDCVEPL